MAHWTAADAHVHVYTFKEGLLSAVGHDLLLEATEVDVLEEDGQITATIGAGSLRTVCAMKHGRQAPGTLSDKDKADIEANLRKSVLSPQRHPSIRFTTTKVDGSRVEGRLELNGATHPVRLSVRTEHGRRVARTELDQRTWGITPFRALLGALKVKPVIQVEISLPAAPET